MDIDTIRFIGMAVGIPLGVLLFTLLLRDKRKRD